MPTPSDPTPESTGEQANSVQPAEPVAVRPPRFARVRRVLLSKRFWIGVLGVTGVSVVLWQRCGISGCPDVALLRSYQPGGASILLDRQGTPFATLAPFDRRIVQLKTLPFHVRAAFISVEDKRFRKHNGIDFQRVAGAALANLRSGRVVQGSSTITMQLARNLYPERVPAQDRSFRRKLLEMRIALDIERRYTKDDILEMYLNHIYFGGGAYGIEAAARYYFGIPAKQLTIEQAAMLAALPKAPAHYDPRRHAEQARQRRNLVLSLMEQQALVTPAVAARARAVGVSTIPARDARPAAPRAAWFVQVVRDLMEERLGEDLYARPHRIHTTIDVNAQRAAEEELENQLRRVEGGVYGRFNAPRRNGYDPANGAPEYLQGAAVVLDAATGDVMALVGGRDIRFSTFNRALVGKRQVGSAFKPFVYAAALSSGWSANNVIDDSPIRFASSRNDTWEPSNFDGQFLGPVTLREALVHSRNVPSIRLANEVGVSQVADVARNAGIKGDIVNSPVIALGVTDASPLELTSAYTVFGSGGNALEPRFIVKVEDTDGSIVWETESTRRQVLDPGVAYIVTDMLRDAVDYGTGRAVRSAGYYGPAAGKTGTTQDLSDAWFVGYTPHVVASVWIGFDQPKPVAGNASGSAAAYAWGRMMNRIERHDQVDWEMPEHVIRVNIDPSSGYALEDGCAPRNGPATTELFLSGREPDERVCPDRGGMRWVGDVADWVGNNLFGWLKSKPEQRDVQVETRPRRYQPRADAGPDRRRNDDHDDDHERLDQRLLERAPFTARQVRERIDAILREERFEDQRDMLRAWAERLEDVLQEARLEAHERRDLARLVDELRRRST